MAASRDHLAFLCAASTTCCISCSFGVRSGFHFNQSLQRRFACRTATAAPGYCGSAGCCTEFGCPTSQVHSRFRSYASLLQCRSPCSCGSNPDGPRCVSSHGSSFPSFRRIRYPHSAHFLSGTASLLFAFESNSRGAYHAAVQTAWPLGQKHETPPCHRGRFHFTFLEGVCQQKSAAHRLSEILNLSDFVTPVRGRAVPALVRDPARGPNYRRSFLERCAPHENCWFHRFVAAEDSAYVSRRSMSSDQPVALPLVKR